MEKPLSSAQHYIECDNCEENPAQFLCKTCTGHLCEPCKSKHEMKKLTRNHDILPLTSNNEEMLDLLCCPKHTTKKLECYCDRCRAPVCTECIIQYHNGHSLKSVATVYREFTKYSKQKIDKIENDLLPSHLALLAKEKEKRSAFKKRADEIEKNIDAHTQSLVEKVNLLGRECAGSLRKAEKEGLKEMDIFIDRMEEKIKILHKLKKQISANLEAKPQPSMLKSTCNNELESFQKLPTPAEYTLTDFQPEELEKKISLGNTPVLQRSENSDLKTTTFNLKTLKDLKVSKEEFLGMNCSLERLKKGIVQRPTPLLCLRSYDTGGLKMMRTFNLSHYDNKLEWFLNNMFYGATVVTSAARITHTLHHRQLSDNLPVIN